MSGYALITLNMIEYAGIYLKNQSAKYSRILNVSDAVHSVRSLYKLLSSYRDRDVFRTLSNIYDGAFSKENNTWVQVHYQKHFRASGRGETVELGHFDKNFPTKHKKKETPLGNILEFSLLDTLKTKFWIENLTQRWTQSGPFFPKFKRAGRPSFSP